MPRVDDRRVISGLLPVLQSECRWRDAPAVYGPYKTLDHRFVRRARKGVWERVFTEVAAADGPPVVLMPDSTPVQAPRAAAGGKGGRGSRQSGGHAGAGLTKLPAAVDEAARPGQRGAAPVGAALVADMPPARRLADTASDREALRA